MSTKPFDIRQRSYLFGRDVFAFTRRNLGSCDFVVRRLAVQLIDAAGSVGANLEEAADGQSKADFISKNCIALKEIREAKFWLRQLRDADPQRLGGPVALLIDEAEELRKIVTSIVISASAEAISAARAPIGRIFVVQRRVLLPSPFSLLPSPFSLVFIKVKYILAPAWRADAAA